MTKQTLNTRIKSFLTSNNTLGAKGLAIVAESITHAFDTNGAKDWTPLGFLVSGLDKTDQRTMKQIVEAVTIDVTASKTPKEKIDNGTPAITFKRGQTSTVFIHAENMAILQSLVDANTSFRSNAVKEALFPSNGGAEYNFEKVKKSAIAATKKLFSETSANGIQFRELINAMEAEWTAQLAEKNHADAEPIVTDDAPANATGRKANKVSKAA